MWRRWLRELTVGLYWLKKDLTLRWKLDTPAGVMGILAVTFGLIFLVIMAQGLATIFRSFIPWVSGARVGETYWASIWFAIKGSLVFLLFCTSVILFFLFKSSNRN